MIKSTHADCLGLIKEMAYTFRYVIITVLTCFVKEGDVFLASQFRAA